MAVFGGCISPGEMVLVVQAVRRLTLTAYSLPSASAEEVGFCPHPKPISFGICSRFVSAPSKLKSDANLFRLATSVLLMG
ncbi:hypothetical protein ACOZXQ_002745 [Cronobacter malonaticus]